MCYILTISTNSPEDLSKFNDGHLFFEKIDNTLKKSVLRYPNQYEIATMAKGSCSCHLRIFDEDLSKEMGFCELQDWLDEEEDADILATRRLFEIIKTIVNQGFKVDSFLSWNDEMPSKINRSQVSVNELDTSHFVLFENAYFDYIN